MEYIKVVFDLVEGSLANIYLSSKIDPHTLIIILMLYLFIYLLSLCCRIPHRK